MPTYTYSGSVAASADEVYAFLADVRNLPRYLPLMTAARAGDAGAVEIETVVKGGVHTMAAWFRPDSSARRIDWGSTDNDGYHGWLAVSADGESRATIDYELTTPRDHNLEPYLAAATTFVDNAMRTAD